MNNPPTRRDLLKLVGAGCSARQPRRQHLSPPVVDTHNVLTVKGGRLHDAVTALHHK